MNLAFLIGHFPPGAFGGAELQAEAWAKRLAPRHRITVITRRDPPDQRAVEHRDGFDVFRVKVSRVPLLRTVFDIGAIQGELYGLEPRPDLLLCFQTFISGLAGVQAQEHFGIPAVVWVRGESEYRLARSWTMRRIAPGVWSRARGVLVQSEANRAALLDELARVTPAGRDRVAAKLEVVPNGLDLPAEVAPPGGRVLSVGRLIPEKGMDVVVDAVAGIQGQLTIAGAGPDRERLEARARRHGLDARFPGFVDRDGLAALYRQAWVVVLASRRGEGLPNVVLEAFAHGRPVIGTPVGGVRDLIADGVNGLIVPADDVRALRDALARLAHEHGLAERLGRAGRETAAAYAWPLVTPRLERLLERWSAR